MLTPLSISHVSCGGYMSLLKQRHSHAQVRLPQRTGSRSYIGHLHLMMQKLSHKCEDNRKKEISLLEQIKTCQMGRNGVIGESAQSVIAKLTEVTKPGKDGLEKTPEECVHAFSNILQGDVHIANNTFLLNAGFVASSSKSNSKSKSEPKSKFKSKSRSLPVQVLEEQLEAERATAAALKVYINQLTVELEASNAHLELARQDHEKVTKMVNT